MSQIYPQMTKMNAAADFGLICLHPRNLRIDSFFRVLKYAGKRKKIPAYAGMTAKKPWMPAFAGMARLGLLRRVAGMTRGGIVRRVRAA
jgi:hypothetical protein